MSDTQTFTLDQVRQLLPWLREVSEEAESAILAAREDVADEVAARVRVHAIIQHWAETVFKLGGLPKQPFTIDFDSGHDYFCWEYPERDIYYRHDYHEGYAGRHRIEDDHE
jgi:hypothetical protein